MGKMYTHKEKHTMQAATSLLSYITLNTKVNDTAYAMHCPIQCIHFTKHSTAHFLYTMSSPSSFPVFYSLPLLFGSQGSSAGSATAYRLDGRGIEVRFLAQARDTSLLHSIQKDSGAPLASYPLDTGGSFPECKATRA
jgi:hypothetical protein